MYRGRETVREICVLVMELPRGARVWQMMGGQMAVTAEVEAVWMLEHLTALVAHGQAGGKGKAPEPREYPKGIEEAEAKADHAVSRAEAFRRKHLNKS
jgi:hypothetical protein